MPSVNAPIRTRHDALPVLSAVPVPPQALADGWPPVWWVGCHGGSGASTLAALTRVGYDHGSAWPLLPQHAPMINVVLVCRASAAGTLAATGAVEQWRRRAVPAHVRVQGVVAVAASPKRPPRIVNERLQLLGGWVPNVWRVGWQEVLLAADLPTDLGVPPPDIAALRDSVVEVVST
ncbi:hypothetical protein [Micromonospora sediminicola]|uniref:hypothetical protein n=1 Tax=Micromonospora sediminicola TaxID=946078 RepID=UPI0033C9CA22